MKYFIYVLFFCFAMPVWSQVPDTIYTKLGPVSADKRSVVTKTTEVAGKKIQEIEVVDSIKVKSAISKLTTDTAQYRLYLRQLDMQSEQIRVEKKRIAIIRRNAARELQDYSEILKKMQKK